MTAAWSKWRGLYINSEMRCTHSFVVFYTERILSPCLYFFLQNKVCSFAILTRNTHHKKIKPKVW